MAIDLMVYWTDKKPSFEDVDKIVTDFFNGAQTSMWKFDENTTFVKLPGKCRSPLHSIDKIAKRRDEDREGPGAVLNSERWIEVALSDEYLSVTTHMSDDYTLTLARGLQEVFVRYYKGRKGAE